MIRNESEHLPAILVAAIQLIIDVGVIGTMFWDTEQVQITFTSGKKHEAGVLGLDACEPLSWLLHKAHW